MSKSTTNTRGKILDRALEMFNERGIEYVGLRELAADLGIRVSNITYYFPTKDDLVFALSAELTRSNSEIIANKQELTLTLFLEMLRRMYMNQVRFKCLMLSFVHVIKQNKKIAAAYSDTQKARHGTLRSNLRVLFDGGYLLIKDEKDIEFLGSMLALIGRFWISEATISFRKESDAKQVEHYLQLVMKLLIPYATEKGRREIDVFMK